MVGKKTTTVSIIIVVINKQGIMVLIVTQVDVNSG